jgi:hypothetical protein
LKCSFGFIISETITLQTRRNKELLPSQPRSAANL